MADTPTPENVTARKTPAKPAKGSVAAKSEGPVKAASRKTAAVAAAADAAPVSAPVAEAKSRFNAALEEAKLGAAALRTAAENRLTTVSGQAKGKSNDLVADAKADGEHAIASLGKVLGDSAAQIDEKLGEQYGDYARKASRTLVETSAKLEAKSVEELGENAREAVRKSPGVAVGVAAVVGFFLARIFGGRRR